VTDEYGDKENESNLNGVSTITSSAAYPVSGSSAAGANAAADPATPAAPAAPLLSYEGPLRLTGNFQPVPSLLQQTVRSSLWTSVGFGAAQVLRLGANLVLTRLLMPEMFGLMTLVNIFIQGLQMFSDVGIGPSIIQNPRGDEPRFLNTAWTIQVARGAALWICSCIIAIPLAHFYGVPLLKWIIPVAGLNALISGVNSTSLFTLNRHLQLAKLTLLELGQQVFAIAGMIVWARFDPSIWALLVPGLIANIGHAAATHFILPGVRNRFAWDPSAKEALFRFGRWIFISTLLTFFAGQSDRLVFGKMIPLNLLGVYGIALMLATTPTQAILKIGATVVFPAYSRVQGDDARFKRIFTRIRLPMVLLGAVGISALIGSGPSLVRVLYRPVYWEAGWILQLLAVAAWFQILECTNGSALLAQGAAHWVATGNAAKLIGMTVLIPLGYVIAKRTGADPFAGAILGVVAAECLKYLTSALGVRRRGLHVLGTDVLCSLLIVAAVLLARKTGNYTQLQLATNWTTFAATFAAACALWLPVALWYVRPKLLGGNPSGIRGELKLTPDSTVQ
jgi:O-antigen/teichoic acid export membrane protein